MSAAIAAHAAEAAMWSHFSTERARNWFGQHYAKAQTQAVILD
jgi:hypothetical protein